MQLEYFRMVDRILSLDTAALTVRAECHIPDHSPVFEGHFPGHPILPGVLMIETIAQTGGWLIMAMQRFTRIPFLAQVREAKMRAFLTPGERVESEVRLLHDGSGYAVAAGAIRRDGRIVAEAEITYRVMPFPNPDMRARMLDTARHVAMPAHFLSDDPNEPRSGEPALDG
jgi:3-hydroxyacyl-[acyl-carrier-protein] dehydratase